MESIIAWVMAHQSILAGLLVGVIDFVIGVNPNTDKTGILHWIVDQLQKLIHSVNPPLPPAK